MVNRVYRVRKIVVLVALAGLGAQLLPDLSGVASHLVRWGPRGLGAADLASDLALGAAVALAIVGIAIRRSWGRWVGRGAGLFTLARVGGAMAASGTTRPLDLLVALAAVVVLVSLPGLDEEYLGGPEPEPGEAWRRGVGGWALALDVAVIPALLASIDLTVASALHESTATLWLVSGGLAALAASGAALLLASRSAGLAVGAAAALVAIGVYRGLAWPGPELGHPELALLLPAAAVACAAAVVHAFAAGRPSPSALLRRSPRPLL